MNKRRSFASATLVIAAVASASGAAAAEWELIGRRPDGVKVYVDRYNIVERGARRLAWFKFDYTTAASNPTRRYVLEKHRREFNCNSQTSRLITAVECDASGAVLRTVEWGPGKSEFKSASPGSIDESAQIAACGQGWPPPAG